MPTNESNTTSLSGDERGAIMVMGIFMCSCLVASLWYLAGIGDAILYRERLQEAADAVAFSEAALHARGMNLIVLINLIMAVILSLRVGVRAGKLAMGVAAAVFAGLGFAVPPLFVAVGPTLAAQAALEQADSAMKAPIDSALNALVLAQQGISLATPTLSRVAARLSVAEKYDLVRQAPLAMVPSHLELPIEKGRPSKLCGEAARVIPDVMTWMFKGVHLDALGEATDAIGEIVKKAVETSPQYFCDLEPGGAAPNTDDNFDDAAKKRCSDPTGAKEEDAYDKAEALWEAACTRHGVVCEGRGPLGLPLPKGLQSGSVVGLKREEKDNLDRLRLERDLSAVSLVEYKLMMSAPVVAAAGCKTWAKKDMLARKKAHEEQAGKQQQESGESKKASTTSSTGVAPMQVKDFQNGSERGQFIAGVIGDHTRLRRASHIVRLGTFNDKRTRAFADSQAALMPAWAQAEMFYDCDAGWKDDRCNSDDDAMWHFKWRARLRRFNQSPEATLRRLSLELGVVPSFRGGHARFADDLAKEVLAPLSSGRKANAGLRVDLAELLRNETTRTHGVH